ncbi:MAG TPA: glycoside hydrolase family 25 protein [Actinomycetota bacterium]
MVRRALVAGSVVLFAVVGLAVPASAKVKTSGIDVSHWQGDIDWTAVAAAGAKFVFAKATEGQTFDDPNYSANRTGAEAAGLAFGAYHYARPDSGTDDAVIEADHFIDTASPASGELIPVLDLEDSGGLSVDDLTAWTWAWLGEVDARLGVKAMIYTNPSFWETFLGDTDQFALGGYRLLWIANWFVHKPSVPGNNWGGFGWTFWQRTDCASIPGISGCVDGDLYRYTDLTKVEIP